MTKYAPFPCPTCGWADLFESCRCYGFPDSHAHRKRNLAEQTIEDDEPMGSIPHVSPAGFDKMVELGQQKKVLSPGMQEAVAEHKRIIENAQGGKKADGGKPRYELLPQRALAEVVKVLTHGADKYGDFNYLKVEEHRYRGAIGRHMAQAVGVSLDDSDPAETDGDSGLLHLAHVACNALILLELRLRQDGDRDPLLHRDEEDA